MPYFKNDDVNILFLHIPKTGGSSVEIYFSSTFNIPLNNDSLYTFIDDEIKLTKNIVINSSLQHITYNQIVKHNEFFNVDFNNAKIITVVRNPYERVISDLFFLSKIKVGISTEEVFDVIKKYLVSTDIDNHNIPQHHFVIDENNQLLPNIIILKTENLTHGMKDLGYADFDRQDNVNGENTNGKNLNYYNYLNDKSIEIINDFYHLDFVLFNYNKITPLTPNIEEE